MRCSAEGCPMDWDIESSRLCSKHHWASDTRDWPEITRVLKEKLADSAIARDRRESEPKKPYPSFEERKRILAKAMTALSAPRDMKGWAKRLKARHKSGDRLTPFQTEAYKKALGEPL